MKNNVYVKSTAAVVAATIGAGIFGVPFVIAQAGALIGLAWIAVIALIVIGENILLADIALAQPDDLRFIGMARNILSKPGAAFVQLLTMISYLGALIAYLILGGKFLQSLLSLFIPVPQLVATLIYFAISSLIIYFGFSFIEKLDRWTVGIIVCLVILIAIIAAPHLSLANFTTIDLGKIFLPYGVILFALSSFNIIPSLEASLGDKKFLLKKSIITGSLVAAALTAIFGLSVAGVSGLMTSSDAITGLASQLGNSIIIIGSIFGLAAILGINTSSGNSLREILQHDYKIPKNISWLAAISLPLAVLLIANPNLITLLGLVGGVVGGLISCSIAWMSLKSRKNILAYAVFIAFAAGAVYELYFSFLK